MKQRLVVVFVEFKPALGRLQRVLLKPVTGGNARCLAGDINTIAEFSRQAKLAGGFEVVHAIQGYFRLH